MAIALNLFFCAAVLLATLWGLIGMISASRRPSYTFADWQHASDRTCWAIRRLNSAPCSSKGHGSSFRQRTCSALLKDLLANTAFILNLVSDASRHIRHPECLCCARDVLTRAVSLRLRLYWARLELCFWPPRAHVSRQHARATERYISLCLAWTAFLEHYVY